MEVDIGSLIFTIFG